MFNSVWDHDPLGYSRLRDCWLNVRRFNYLKDFINTLKDGDLVLEIGSGTGNLILELAAQYRGINFVGVEPLHSYVEHAKQEAQRRALSNLRFICGLGEDVQNIFHQKCRLILSNDVIHHVRDPRILCSSLSNVADEDTEWIAIEPNYLNFYTFIKQATGAGEQNFLPKYFLKNAPDWRLVFKRYLFLIPPFIKNPSYLLKRVETAFEWMPLIAGGIALHLKYDGTIDS